MLDELWTRAETLVRDALAGLCDDVARHPGEFTEDDLRDLASGKASLNTGPSESAPGAPVSKKGASDRLFTLNSMKGF